LTWAASTFGFKYVFIYYDNIVNVFNYPAGIANMGAVDQDYSTLTFATISQAMVIPLIPNFSGKDNLFITSYQYNTWIANITGLRNAEGPRIAETFARQTYDYATPLFGMAILMIIPINLGGTNGETFTASAQGLELMMDGPVNNEIMAFQGKKSVGTGTFQTSGFAQDTFPLTNLPDSELHAYFFMINVGGLDVSDFTTVNAVPWAIKIPKKSVLVFALWINTCIYNPSRNVVTKQINYVFAACMMIFLSVYRTYDSNSNDPNVILDNSGVEPEARNTQYLFPLNKYFEPSKAVNLIPEEVIVVNNSE